MILLDALGAAPEELQFVIEIHKTGIPADFFFELVDGAGGFDGFDAAAVGTNEVVAMLSRDKESEIGSPFVEPKTAHHALFGEALEKPEDGGFVALLREVPAGGQLCQGHGTIVIRQTGQDGFESLGATQAAGACPGNQIVLE